MKKLFSIIVCIFSVLVIIIPSFSLVGSAAEATKPTVSPIGRPTAAETLSTDYDHLLSYVNSFGCFNVITDSPGVDYEKSNFANVSKLPKNASNGYINGICYVKLTSRIGISFEYENEYQFTNFLILQNGIYNKMNFKSFDNYMYYVYKTKSTESEIAGMPLFHDNLNHTIIVLTDYSFGYSDYNDTVDTSAPADKIKVKQNKNSDFCYLFKSSNMYITDKEFDGLDGVKYRTFNWETFGDSYTSLQPSFIYKKDFSKLDDVLSIQHRNYLSDVFDPDINKPKVYSNMEINGVSGDRLINSSGGGGSAFADDVSFFVTPDLSGNIQPHGKFKFNITNNSNTNIIWCFYISGQDVATSGLDDIESSDWIYICEEDYHKYNFDNVDPGGTAYLSDFNGSMYVHLLEAGKSYSDSVSWNNTQLYNNLNYSARCLIFPSEDTIVNWTDYESQKYEDFLSVSETIGSTAAYASGFGIMYSIGSDAVKSLDLPILLPESSTSFNFSNPVYIYNSNFSLTDNTLYTRANLNGNGISNRGFKDAVAQTQNYYSYEYEGDTVYNENYSEPYLLDTSTNWDGISVDDVKNLVNGTKTFFDIFSSIFNFFPAFVWVIISLGVIFIVAIALIKLFL